MFKNRNNQNGFSLVEMLVVLAILVIILSLTLVDYRRAAQLQEFRTAISLLASTLRDAQTSALTGYAEDDSLGQRYGIHFEIDQLDLGENDQYLFFKDNGEKVYEPSEDEVIETVAFPPFVNTIDVYVDEVELNPSGNYSPTYDFVFSPPKPSIYANDSVAWDKVELVIWRSYGYVSSIEYCSIVNINRLTGKVDFNIYTDFATFPNKCPDA